MKTADEINKELLAYRCSWGALSYQKVIDYYKGHLDKGKISCSFLFGVTDSYINSKKKIMIVGQEARKLTIDYKKWRFENMQQWCIEWFNYKVNGQSPEKFKDIVESGKKTSPFWNFIKKISEKGYGVCWNNIDKVTRYVKKDDEEYYEAHLLEEQDKSEIKDRSILHRKIFDAKSVSLLQKEIKIAKPDIVVFAIGPQWPYYHSLCSAFFDDPEGIDDKLNGKWPTTTDYCVDITQDLNLDIPAYYTYHPAYLNREGAMDNVINKILAATK